MTPEFSLIHQYFNRPTGHTALGVGDDAALINITSGQQLVVSADMLVAGTHFFVDASPYTIGWKSLAVNISDMAAMGAQPKWATLSIALPDIDHDWLTAFSRGFFDCAQAFNVDLIGGDTTRGPLNIVVQIIGEVPINQAIRRDGAKLGDEIWVSGDLGDAALALAALQNRLSIQPDELVNCQTALDQPQPRVGLGLALRNIATSAIDISDGLLADLGHILIASNLNAELVMSAIPVSATVNKYLHLQNIKDLILAGGDDYELCFTAPVTKHQHILTLSQTLNLKLSKIGKIVEAAHQSGKIDLLDNSGEKITIAHTGYDHFV